MQWLQDVAAAGLAHGSWRLLDGWKSLAELEDVAVPSIVAYEAVLVDDAEGVWSGWAGPGR